MYSIFSSSCNSTATFSFSKGKEASKGCADTSIYSILTLSHFTFLLINMLIVFLCYILHNSFGHHLLGSLNNLHFSSFFHFLYHRCNFCSFWVWKHLLYRDEWTWYPQCIQIIFQLFSRFSFHPPSIYNKYFIIFNFNLFNYTADSLPTCIILKERIMSTGRINLSNIMTTIILDIYLNIRIRYIFEYKDYI